MYGYIGAWMHGGMDECTDTLMHGCMDAWMHGCMDAWMHGCMDAWMNGREGAGKIKLLGRLQERVHG